MEPASRGDPESALRWTCKSVRQLAGELTRVGHRVSPRLVAELLHGTLTAMRSSTTSMRRSGCFRPIARR